MNIAQLAAKYFPHLLPQHGQALVAELLELRAKLPITTTDSPPTN
jgi:hypothetical protein